MVEAKRGYDVAAGDQGQIVRYSLFYMKYASVEEVISAARPGTTISAIRHLSRL